MLILGDPSEWIALVPCRRELPFLLGRWVLLPNGALIGSFLLFAYGLIFRDPPSASVAPAGAEPSIVANL